MAKSEQEQKELTELKDQITEIKVNAFATLTYLATGNRELLDAAGYKGKTNGEAVVISLKNQKSRIEGLIRAYERKWPD